MQLTQSRAKLLHMLLIYTKQLFYSHDQEVLGCIYKIRLWNTLQNLRSEHSKHQLFNHYETVFISRENILFDMPAQGFCVLDYVDPWEITYIGGLNNIQQIS